jgi:hypothetical protein
MKITFYCTVVSVKDNLQGYSNFRNCIEAKEKLKVALQYVLVIAVRIKINYMFKMLHAIITQCILKGNYTRKIKSYMKLK